MANRPMKSWWEVDKINEDGFEVLIYVLHERTQTISPAKIGYVSRSVLKYIDEIYEEAAKQGADLDKNFRYEDIEMLAVEGEDAERFMPGDRVMTSHRFRFWGK